MSLKIYNSLGRKLEDFIPLEEGKVKMYVCGPTVYDLLHVGNFRGAIFFNLVRNWLERLGYKVTFVYNYTDIDDKIINRANETNQSALELSQTFIKEFENDFASLQLTPHDHNPKCSDHIDEMTQFIQTLIDKDFAYEIEGEVFFNISSFKDYGKLSGKNIDDLQAGHRVDPDPRKKNPLDFVLWKPSKEGEPAWDSPWGKGRPGWHIECSCMNHSFFGDQIDIHGGGIDLTFPHHENEIAQSEAASGKSFAKYWMHNNFIQFGDNKMSKSEGNVVQARDFIAKYNPEILKFLMLSVHYRSPLNLEDSQIQQAFGRLARIYSALRQADDVLAQDLAEGELDKEFQNALQKADTDISSALNDDFNTPAMFAVIFEIVRLFNASFEKGKKVDGQLYARAKAFKDWLQSYGKLVSLFQEGAKNFLKSLDLILLEEKGVNPEEIDTMVQSRSEARANKDFQEADNIRNKLDEMGILIHDSADKTTWEVKKGQ